jgi:AsmA protein
MKALRILGLLGGIVLALLLVLGGVLYALFDSDKIKAQLTQTVFEKTQRRLEISGPLQLSLWPNVGIKLGRATLSEHASGKPFLALNSARVSVAVMPLLQKQINIDGIAVDGLNVLLIKRKDGTLNIADLTAGGSDTPDEKVGAGDTAAKDRKALHIDVASIRLNNAQLTWRDEKTGASTTLSKLNFSTGHVAADSASGTLAIESLALATHIQNAADGIDLELAAPQLKLTPEQATGKSVTLSARLAGNGRRATIQLMLSDVTGTLHDLKAALVFDMDAQTGETKLKTHLTSPLAANFTTQNIALGKIAGSADIAHPAMPMQQVHLPLNGNLRLDLTNQKAALNLTTQFDESKVRLAANAEKFSPLALGFDLALDRLNVDKYLPPKPEAAKAGAAAPGSASGTGAGRSSAETPLDFSALNGLNLHGALSIGSLQVSKLKFANLHAQLKLANGRLNVAPLAANLYGGSMNGSMMVNANGNAVALRQTLAGISINPLLKDLANKDLLAGKGALMVDVTGRGATVSALKKSLNGAASLSLRDGAIKGINLAQSLRDIQARLGKQDVTQQSNSAAQTDFSELSASFRITNGVAHNEDLAMKSPFLRLTGAGDVDIGNSQINYLAKASVVQNDTGQGGKDLDQLRGLTIPVRITGPLENISWKIEVASLINDAVKAKAKAQLDEKKQELQQKAGDKLKERLKGLFGK